MTCQQCATSPEWCGPGWTWPMHCGPCIACGRETITSAACGHPHCDDCRKPQPEPAHESVFAVTARVYARMGWKVFPLVPRGKAPLIQSAHPEGDPLRGVCKGGCGKFGHGVHDATDDLDVLATWWAKCPTANIGIAADANGLAVIDVDSRKGGDESLATLIAVADARGVDLMNTLTQHTGGGGLHLIYVAPKGGIKSKANAFGPDMPGLDTRGRGAAFVGAPSIHASGATYDWVDLGADVAPWPDFLTLLVDPKKAEYTQHLQTDRKPIGDKYVANALDDELAILESTRECRNDQLNKSAFNMGTLVGAGLLDEHVARGELYNAAVRNGYVAKDGPRETLSTIDSGLTKGKAKPRAGVR